MENQNLAIAKKAHPPNNQEELLKAAHNALFEVNFENVIQGVEPWIHEPKKNLWKKFLEARPWFWPVAIFDAVFGGELVRHVGPNEQPLKRHEWEKKEYF